MEITAQEYLEATMAALITLATVAILLGVAIGALLYLSRAIRKEDRFREGSLRCDAPSWSAQTARTLVGVALPSGTRRKAT